MEKLRGVLRGVDTFTKWQGYLLVPLVPALVGITIYDITARQLGMFTAWAFDVEWFIYGSLLMLAMGYTALKDQHVRIDLLTTRFSPRVQAALMAFSYAVFVIPLMVMLGIYAFDFALEAKTIGEMTLMAWASPLWPVKSFIFLGVCFLLPQCFAELIRNIYFVIKKEKL